MSRDFDRQHLIVWVAVSRQGAQVCFLHLKPFPAGLIEAFDNLLNQLLVLGNRWEVNRLPQQQGLMQAVFEMSMRRFN